MGLFNRKSFTAVHPPASHCQVLGLLDGWELRDSRGCRSSSVLGGNSGCRSSLRSEEFILMQNERNRKHDAPFKCLSQVGPADTRLAHYRRGGAGFKACYPYPIQPLEGLCWMNCAKKILSKYMRRLGGIGSRTTTGMASRVSIGYRVNVMDQGSRLALERLSFPLHSWQRLPRC